MAHYVKNLQGGKYLLKYAFCLTYKHWIRLEMLGRDFKNCGPKKFYNIGSRRRPTNPPVEDVESGVPQVHKLKLMFILKIYILL